ncbi:hypothetical protein HDV62DRAFT_287688 [Trichoderma sp. SZMC 28011]
MARTRQLGTGGVVSSRIGWPARSCMPACLTVSARRLLEALNGRDALPISPGPASSTSCNLVGPLPPLRFSSLCSLFSAVWRAWLAQREKRGQQKGLVTVALREQQAISSVVFSNVNGQGSGRAASLCCRRGDDGREIRYYAGFPRVPVVNVQCTSHSAHQHMH